LKINNSKTNNCYKYKCKLIQVSFLFLYSYLFICDDRDVRSCASALCVKDLD